MFRRLEDRQLLTTIALKRVRRKCKQEGHEEHCELIDKALSADDSDEIIALLGMEIEQKAIPPNDFILAGDDEDGPFLRFLKYIMENPEQFLKLLEGILKLFMIL